MIRYNKRGFCGIVRVHGDNSLGRNQRITMGSNLNCKTITLATIIIVMGLLLGLFTTYEYFSARGLDYLEHGNQIKRLHAVLEGHAGNPWQYRVLAPYLINVVFELFEQLHIPHPIAISFIFFRVIQDTIVLLLSYTYYRNSSLDKPNFPDFGSG